MRFRYLFECNYSHLVKSLAITEMTLLVQAHLACILA